MSYTRLRKAYGKPSVSKAGLLPGRSPFKSKTLDKRVKGAARHPKKRRSVMASFASKLTKDLS